MASSPLFFTPLFLARKNMRSRRGRTLLTLVGIILGVAVVLAIQITNQNTLDSLRRVFDRTTGQANLLVISSGNNGQALEETLLPVLEKADGVDIAAPSLNARTLLARDAASWQIAFSMSGIAEGNFFLLYGIDPLRDPEVRAYELASGHMPETGKYQTLITEKLAADKNLNIGEDLVFLVPDGTARLEIVGLLADEGVAVLNDGKVGFAPLEIVQDLYDRSGELDEIAIRATRSIGENPATLSGLKDRLSERVGKDGQVIYPAARGQLVSQMLTTYQLGLTFFSIIAIFVGAFLIYNAFSMTIIERTREIGMLRSIGMSRAQIMSMVLAEAAILSVIGSLAGMGAGVIMARSLITLLGNVVTAEAVPISIPFQGITQSLLVGIGVTLTASLLPAIQAARISPLEALRIRSRSDQRSRPVVWISGVVLLFIGWTAVNYLEWRDEVVFFAGNFALICFFLGGTLTVTLAVGWLEYLTRPLATLLYGQEGSLGSANVRRAIGRTTLTVASLMVALTMIIGITSLAYSFEKDMSGWIDNALGGDLYVRAPLPMRESFIHQLQNIPGVQAITPNRIITIKISAKSLHAQSDGNRNFYFSAIDPTSFRQIGDMEFVANQGDAQANWERFSQGQALFISSQTADRFNLHRGDNVLLLTSRGEVPFYIVAEVLDFGGQGQIIYGSYADLHRWFSEQGVDRFTLSIAPGHSVEAAAQEITARYQNSRHINVQTTQAFKDSILDLMNRSFRLFDVLNLIGVIIGSLGVINTLTMNVIERRREIGGLRSLGLTRSQILQMVLAESLTLGVMGAIYGLGMGLVISQTLIRGANLLVGYDLTYRFTPNPFIVGIFIALVVVQIAAIYPARRAARVNIVEAIKHE